MDESRQSNFEEERERLQQGLVDFADTGMKRFLALDHQAYLDGALPSRTKELLGLVASVALRCDDCISYHLVQCRKCGVTDAELEEALNVALVVGGSITIPHLRRAVAFWKDLA